MGLDTTHGAWHGAYSGFHRWRCAVATAAGATNVEEFRACKALCAGVPPVLSILLDHSDCDGEIAAKDCEPIARELEKLLPALDAMGDGGGHIGEYGRATRQFISGLWAASAANEPLGFH